MARCDIKCRQKQESDTSVRHSITALFRSNLLLHLGAAVVASRPNALLIAVQDPVSECRVLELAATDFNPGQDIFVC
jgi:hypothetical protein